MFRGVRGVQETPEEASKSRARKRRPKKRRARATLSPKRPFLAPLKTRGVPRGAQKGPPGAARTPRAARGDAHQREPKKGNKKALKPHLAATGRKWKLSSKTMYPSRDLISSALSIYSLYVDIGLVAPQWGLRACGWVEQPRDVKTNIIFGSDFFVDAPFGPTDAF